MNKTFLPVFVCIILFSLAFAAFTSRAKLNFRTDAIVADTSGPFVFMAKDHKGKSTVSTSGVISFTTGLDNDFYNADSTNRSVYFYVEAKLAKLLNVPITRTPLNISIVIDRSGSMQGVKMGYAKKAAKGIIDHLQNTDFVSVVMYDNAIDSVQEPIAVTDEEMIKARIDHITPRGSTNLWGGTERGYEYVQKNYKPGFINRVLLVSDGLANVGITDSVVIREKVQKYKELDGITLSTFGVGLDYNETLMTDMAETGGGNYYYIDAPEKMVSMLDKELSGMLNVVARNAELQIKIPAGVTIEKCYPLKYRQAGDVIVVRFLDLFAEETKGSLLKFNINDRTGTTLKFISTLRYTDVMDDKQKTVSNENILSPVRNTNAYLTHFNRQVIEEAIFFTANENLEIAMAEVDRKNFKKAEEYLMDNESYLRANEAYVSGDEELMRMEMQNTNYTNRIANAANLSVDSVKRIQKSNKAANYNLRYKKQ